MLVLFTLFYACDKSAITEELAAPAITCRAIAILLPDSVNCGNKNYFLVGNSNTPIVVATGNVAIDTIVGEASFEISYTNLSGSTQCHGAVWQNAALTCFKRK